MSRARRWRPYAHRDSQTGAVVWLVPAASLDRYAQSRRTCEPVADWEHFVTWVKTRDAWGGGVTIYVEAANLLSHLERELGLEPDRLLALVRSYRRCKGTIAETADEVIAWRAEVGLPFPSGYVHRLKVAVIEAKSTPYESFLEELVLPIVPRAANE